ncbi:hypothetical protein BGX28_007385 [Mortierella sp. GBA30]|nr:hypothetical protein BGX28_007385 [Mortierella sp. GBA30]
MCGSGGHEQNQHQDIAAAIAFPEDLYAQLTDAHCHIQDDRDHIHSLVQSWAKHADNNTIGYNATTPLLAGKVCLMGVQPSKNLGISIKEDSDQTAVTERTASLSLSSASVRSSSTAVVIVTWNDTDTLGDWDLVSELAHNHPDRFIPCFGIHPWFTHKYKAVETFTGPMLELRGVSGAASPKPGSSASASSSPSLSFSADSLTAIPDAGLCREDFLAMSKQLQEQIAKEGQRKTDVAVQADPAVSGSQGQVLEKKKEEKDAKDGSIDTTNSQEQDPAYVHYKAVLSLPNSVPHGCLSDLAKRLPEPRALEPALKELRRKLEEHPHAILGEIGLDRIARVPEPSLSSIATMVDPVEEEPDGAKKEQSPQQKKTTLALTSIHHQLEIVREQLKLAASLNRAVSFHCVQAYGHWHDFLIQEGKRVRQIEAHKEYQQHLHEIHASGGTPTIAPISPTGRPLSKRTAARLKKEARDAAWERHVASTLQESSDDYDSDQDQGSSDDDERAGFKAKTQDSGAKQLNPPIRSDAIDLLPPLPPYEPVLPPRLCMHSYGGSVDMLKAFAKLDHAPEIFFSFSILINGRLQERKLRELILAVPEDRLLIETDHHSHLQVDQLLIEMVQKIAEVRHWTLKETVEKTARNWKRFVYG